MLVNMLELILQVLYIVSGLVVKEEDKHQENVQKIEILPESQELPVVKSSFRKWQEML